MAASINKDDEEDDDCLSSIDSCDNSDILSDLGSLSEDVQVMDSDLQELGDLALKSTINKKQQAKSVIPSKICVVKPDDNIASSIGQPKQPSEEDGLLC